MPLLNGLYVSKKLIFRKNQFTVLEAGMRKVEARLGLTTFGGAFDFAWIYPIGDPFAFRLSGETVSYRINGVGLK